jgi:integrase
MRPGHHDGHVRADDRTPDELARVDCPGGRPGGRGNFRDRIWYPAIERAGVRRYPPKVMRHTAASWLVIDGVPLHDVQHLLGHESYRTMECYAHPAADATTALSSRGSSA